MGQKTHNESVIKQLNLSEGIHILNLRKNNIQGAIEQLKLPENIHILE
jgi:cell division septal protein FtsQ